MNLLNLLQEFESDPMDYQTLVTPKYDGFLHPKLLPELLSYILSQRLLRDLSIAGRTTFEEDDQTHGAQREYV